MGKEKDYILICYSLSRNKQLRHRLKEMFAKDTFDKVLLSKYIQGTLKIQSLRKQATQLKNEQKTLPDTLPKKIHQWQIGILKDAPPRISLGNCNLRQWDTPKRLSERPNSRILTTVIASKDMEQQEVLFIAGWNAKLYSHVGRQFGKVFYFVVVVYKTTHIHTMCLPRS